MLMASQLYKNVPFNPTKDFSSVSLAAWGTLMMVSNPKTGIKTVNDLITQAKAKPGYINFGSPGIGTPHHMAMELFKVKTNLFMLHVPYRGTAGYTQDILSGEIMVGFLPVHIAQGFVQAGKLNAIAVGSPKRHPVAPNVATFGELGIKDIEVDLWYAFFAPSKTSTPIVNRLNTEISGILKLPEISDLLKRAGMDASGSTTEELTQLVSKDYPRWGEVIRRNGITAE
jgi:tripartite-type tricarboxylate transporter receptor subunit TctC